MGGEIDKIVELLGKCGSILFITGAGISAESGLPTYRGIGGLYEARETEDGILVEAALSGDMLIENPQVTWKYLLEIERKCRDAMFNRAHRIIAEMQMLFKRVWVLTQNVDGFHTAAGAGNVIEIHGRLHHLKCMKCPWRKDVDDFSGLSLPPQCPQCGFFIRPDVVFFGESLAFDKYQALNHQLEKGFDIYFWVGTTGVFPYIQAPLLDARGAGKPAVEINPDETILSSEVDIKVAMKATEALEEIWRKYKKDR